MTTRPRAPQLSPKPNRPRQQACSGGAFVAAESALPPRVSHVPRAPLAGHVAAVWRANDAPIAGIRGLGSTAGSTAGRGIAVHTPCGGKSATPAAGPWPRARLRLGWFGWYPARVPWEVVTPWGRPGRMQFILLGHFTPTISSFSDRRRGGDPLPKQFPPPSREGNGKARRDAFRRGGECQASRRKPGRTRTRCIWS